MPAIPTQHKPTLEEVRTGSKPFQLFPQDKTRKWFTNVGKTYIYDRKILLDTDGLLPELPIRLYAGATHMSHISALSPYTNDGYQFTGKETNPEHRAHILGTIDREKEIDYARAPLSLDASIHNAVLRNMKLTEQKQTFPDPLLPGAREILSRLRFHVALPRRDTLDGEQPHYDTFISRPDETAFALGELSFRHFSPQDSPTLQKKSTEGYFLMLPSDDNIIQNIQGQFIMMPPGTQQS